MVGCRLSVVGEKPATGSRPSATGQSESGFTLLELIITLAIIAIMVAGTVPFAQNMVKREKEVELRRSLRDIRRAIDGFKAYCGPSPGNDIHKSAAAKEDCYPNSLEVLVNGLPVPGKPDDEPIRFLRRIPIDPFTGNADWGVRTMEDEPFSDSGSGPSSSNGIWDVYSRAPGKSLDGITEYKNW